MRLIFADIFAFADFLLLIIARFSLFSAPFLSRCHAIIDIDAMLPLRHFDFRH